MNFDDLKRNWQQQENAVLPQQLSARVLRQIDEQHQAYLASRRTLLRTMLPTLAWVVLMWWWFEDRLGWQYDALLGAMSLVIVALMLVYGGRPVPSADPSLTADHHSYLQAQVRAMRHRIRIGRIYMPLYALGIAVISLLYTQYMLQSVGTGVRLAVAVGMSLFFVIIGAYGFRREYRRRQQEQLPLLRQLEEMLSTQESPAE